MPFWAVAAPIIASVAGSAMQGLFNKGMADSANAQTREIAQHGLEWKAEDARRAGINPVFAVSSGANAGAGASATISPPDTTGALQAGLTAWQRRNETKMTNAQLKVAEANIGKAQAEAFQAQMNGMSTAQQLEMMRPQVLRAKALEQIYGGKAGQALAWIEALGPAANVVLGAAGLGVKGAVARAAINKFAGSRDSGSKKLPKLD